MAEVLVDIAGAVLKNLGALLGQEIGLLWGLSDELGKLKETVKTIRAVLHDAEKRSRTDEAAKVWLHDLKDVVYDADDLLDDISTEVLRQKLKSGNVVVKKVRLSFSSSNRLAYGLKMAHKVKAIRERLDGIADKRKFQLNQNIVEQAFEMNHDRDTHSCAPPVVIGREDDKKKLVSLLLDRHEKKLVVISIVGMGGLGKTTLAQMIYDDEKVKAHFDLKVWVCVSNNFDVKFIVEKMIECIDKNPYENLGMEKLKSELHKKVKGKKCLFVLDDIWNEKRQKWVLLSDLIACVAPGSRIVVTTRSNIVAEITGALKIYELEDLPQKESWDLFQQVAFNQGHFPNSEFEQLGKEIAEGCQGHPLAIRTIGSLLYTKKKESEWRQFKDEEFSKLDTKADILKTLELSYNHLPPEWKPCFTYCSLFPADYVFDVYRLISYWKAQGYVGSKTEGTSSQDDGLNCFKKLVQRSFFQIKQETEDGKIFTCRMHDFMHDLAMSVAGEEVKMLRYGSSDGATATGKTRHMSLHMDIGEVKLQLQHVAPLLQGKKARTLIFQRTYSLEKECLSMIIDELRCLRVLSLQQIRFKKLPSFIDKLKHLRQLDLSRNPSIEMLPDTITRLLNLQELNMDGCVALKKLPRDMEKLVNLVILGLKRCNKLEEMPRGIGKLTSLEVLSRINLPGKRRHDTGGLDELEKLNKLRGKLKLSNLQRLEKGARECEVANLKDKPHLRSLTLEWGNSHEVEDMTNEEKSLEALQPHGNLRKLTLVDYRGARFPDWISFLQNLVKIKMVNCGNCKYLPSLDGLPSLKRLLVKELQRLEYMIDNSGNTKIADASYFFPNLETLIVWDCPKLKGWWSSEEKLWSTEEEWWSTEEELWSTEEEWWSTEEELWSPEEQPPLHYQLPQLFELEIRRCPNFKGWMPKLPSLKDLRLILVTTGLLVETLKKAKPPSTITGTPPLQSLTCWRIIDLGVLHEVALQNLASLKSLLIRLKDTRALSPWLHHLTSLERLEIYYCEETNLFEENNTELIQPLGLINLRFLQLNSCLNMKCLPRRFQYLTTLEELEIAGCDELESMPTWVRNLTSLKRLLIFDCPLLSERCGSNQGEDWPSISHIPDINVDDTQIQLNGSYQL